MNKKKLFASLALVFVAAQPAYSQWGGGYNESAGYYGDRPDIAPPEEAYREGYRHAESRLRDDAYEIERQEDRLRRKEDELYRRERELSGNGMPPANANVVRPSCPAGTNFDGKSCIITDGSKRRPGGDGRINPCPKGMWVSGGVCVSS